MEKLVVSIILLLAFSTCLTSAFKISSQSCENGPFPPSDSPQVPTEVINLDVSPGDRYNDLAAKKDKQLHALLDYIKNFTSFILNGKLFGIIDKDLAPLVYTLPSPYKEEIIGLSKASGIPIGEVLLYNIFYEIFTVCTSIVAQDKQGKLYHARNLDFGLFLGWDNKTDTWSLSEVLRPLVVQLDYRRGGKTLYKTVTFAGYVGVITGLKPGVLTLTLNERFNINGGYIGMIEWILGKRSAKWTSFITRDVLEQASSYAEAHDMLANTEVLAPVYYILGGNQSGQGVVLTRDRTKNLKENSLDPKNGKWFVLETNYDFWEPPLVFDDRRTPGTYCMQHGGQNALSMKSLYNVLSTQPVLNKLTTYTVVMQANSGEMMTYIRNCPDPCFPW
ncbi:acid ceramidase-like [Actinia tenebrosa]|uniref:Acid ceramidase n=1 Tax=Actinia tenebrosa TaxID=6105 RepID=A0A6P8H9A2_ACTTE|nr:acid ceramidase-like [Actinia tenebrosa]